jgi:hypothetical protein
MEATPVGLASPALTKQEFSDCRRCGQAIKQSPKQLSLKSNFAIFFNILREKQDRSPIKKNA